MKMIIEENGGSVAGVVITKMERETFFAELRLKRAGREFVIDCRPSDAIGLAIRSGAPVFVRREVLTRHGVDPASPDKSDRPIKT
jgi:bifunctional DNase/RNase